MQGIVGRNIDTNETTVVGITAINGANTNNVILDEVKLKSICRTYNNKLKKEILKRIETVSKNISKSMEGNIKIKHILEYLAVINTKKETEDIIEIVKKL